jgi:hypothetical protein
MRRDNVDGTGRPELANDFKPRLAVSMPSPPYLVYVQQIASQYLIRCTPSFLVPISNNGEHRLRLCNIHQSD